MFSLVVTELKTGSSLLTKFQFGLKLSAVQGWTSWTTTSEVSKVYSKDCGSKSQQLEVGRAGIGGSAQLRSEVGFAWYLLVLSFFAS